MRLYYSPGASSLAPHVALREAGRAFALERVDVKTQRTESGRDYREVNPKGYVPALALDDRGDEILTEVAAILQYIADLVPDRWLAPPNGTFLRYHLQEWLSFLAGELDEQLGWLSVPDTPAHTKARARGRIGDRLTYVNGLLADRAHVMGETFTVADAYLFVILRTCERVEIDPMLWPNLDAYYHRVLERSSVQGALAAEGLLDTHRLRRTG